MINFLQLQSYRSRDEGLLTRQLAYLRLLGAPSLHNNAPSGQAWAGSHARSPRPTQPKQKRYQLLGGLWMGGLFKGGPFFKHPGQTARGPFVLGRKQHAENSKQHAENIKTTCQNIKNNTPKHQNNTPKHQNNTPKHQNNPPKHQNNPPKHQKQHVSFAKTTKQHAKTTLTTKPNKTTRVVFSLLSGNRLEWRAVETLQAPPTV